MRNILLCAAVLVYLNISVCIHSFFLFLSQSDVQLIKTGDKVGASEATLLNMLNISPFSFGLVIQQVFDNGSIYNPEVLDITEETLHKRFLEVSATAPVDYYVQLFHCREKKNRRPCPRAECRLWCFLQCCRARSSPRCPGEMVGQGAPSVGCFG